MTLHALVVDPDDTDGTHIATLDVASTSAPVSSPPSSSPAVVTPPDCLGEADDDTREECAHSSSRGKKPMSPFLTRLDDLLLAAQRERFAEGDLSSIQPQDTHPSATGASSNEPSPRTQQTVRKRRKSMMNSVSLAALDPDGPTKKRRLSNQRCVPRRTSSRHALPSSVARLFGAFRLQYAKGPGSLRRAESLRSELSTVEEEEVLNEVIDSSEPQAARTPQRRGAPIPQRLPIIVGSIASPFGGYAPTVPTTPTATDVDQDQPTPASVSSPVLAVVPVLAPPSFEQIPRAPLCGEERAERRITALLAREWTTRDADGLHAARSSETVASPVEDGESIEIEENHDDDEDTQSSASMEPRAQEGNITPRKPETRRALISNAHIELDIDDVLLEQCIHWFLEIMPPDDFKTSYSPGDLYDLLSTSLEVRFHAAHLFLRYLLLARSSPSSAASEDTASISSEDQESLEAVTWDVAVACLALSVKFHRDVLFPLDVIYAHEFVDLAAHEMAFEDLENAQRDVLEAVAYQLGSATPGAFMDELWHALPTLRKLVAFDGGWDDVQKEAWSVLYDALQHAEVLLYPISLLTGAAVSEGIVEVLSKRMKATGTDARGRGVGKRDAKSLRKLSMKLSCDVRLDIQDVLEIPTDELLACQSWLSLTME